MVAVIPAVLLAGAFPSSAAAVAVFTGEEKEEPEAVHVPKDGSVMVPGEATV